MKRVWLILLMGLLLTGCINDNSSEETGSEKTSSESKDKKDNNDNKDKKDKKEKINEEEWLRDIAYENIENLIELSSDEKYVLLLGASDEINSNISNWSDADIDEDEDVVVVKTKASSFAGFLGNTVDIDDLSDAAKDNLNSRMGAAISSMIGARQGTAVLASVSMVQTGKSYIAPVEIENQSWIVPSDQEGLAYYVWFSNSGEGVVSVGVSFLYYGEDTTIKKAVKSAAVFCDTDTIEVDW